jgi:signal transduction histidine kinase
MLMPTSSEFVTLCRSQVALLTQALGASLSIIYLTEELVEDASAHLVPIVAHPEFSVALEKVQRIALQRIALQGDEGTGSQKQPEIIQPEVVDQGSLSLQRQLVLPLIHEEMVLGLLVTERDDRAWTVWERGQVERIAQTLSLACVMDQRAQWLEQNHRQQRQMQMQQHDVMDNLLHQLRSPLTALRTFGKLLMKRMQPGDGNHEIASSVVQQSDRIQDLLQQFDEAIDLTDAEPLPASDSSSAIPLLPAGVLAQSNLELEPCSIPDILQPLLVSASAIALERNLTLRTAIPDGLPDAIANPGALREVLSNLIDNALKYTPEGGAVHVRVDLDSPKVIVQVTDTGLGIPPEDLPRLFERHFRGVQAQGEIPGTGLGLAIARRLVEQMQGTIWVFSPLQKEGWISLADQPPERKGTTFRVELLTR